MAQTTVPTFLLAFRQNLALRPLLSNVRVDLVPTGDLSSRESIILVNGRIEGGQARYAMGIRSDSYKIPGQLTAFGADPDTDRAFQTAFSRAGAILDELILELDANRPSVGTQSLEGILTTIGYTPYVVENGGWSCTCDFVVEYEAITR